MKLASSASKKKILEQVLGEYIIEAEAEAEGKTKAKDRIELSFKDLQSSTFAIYVI